MGRSGHPLRVATTAAAFSGNKGAASMLAAVIDNLPNHVGECRFDVLTTYPERDAPLAPAAATVVSFKPLQVLLTFPVAILAGLATRLGVPARIFRWTPALRALIDADVVVDVAGISFVDGRGIPILAYNAMMAAIPLLLGRPVVKVAQALGPFDKPLNRAAARLILPRIAWIGARGEKTAEHLDALGLHNFAQVADLAFTMHVPPDAETAADELIGRWDGTRIGVAPSSVVDRYCQKAGIDYAKLMAEFIDGLAADTDLEVMAFAHSAIPGAGESRMNDLPVLGRIAELSSHPRLRVVADDLSPAELRALISRCDLVVTSRFHAMVSALATGTPVLVVGWSHKYGEVLADFGLSGQALDYSELTPAGLLVRLKERLAALAEDEALIRSAQPTVADRSEENYRAVARVVEGRP